MQAAVLASHLKSANCVGRQNEATKDVVLRTPKSTATAPRRSTTTFPGCKSRSLGNGTSSRLHAACVAGSPTAQRATV